MRRPAAAENTLARIQRWRTICPDLALRSTFIVGFPGETEEDFETLLGFLEEAQLDRVGAFKYSAVNGAAANLLPDPVPEELKEERYGRLMDLQARISQARLTAKIGRTLSVLVDEVDAEGAIARSQADAPEIDGVVFIDEGAHLQPGDQVQVIVTGATEHDLQARLI